MKAKEKRARRGKKMTMPRAAAKAQSALKR